MAFVVPSQSFDTGSPILGALTGFTEGLSSGIKARRQQDIEQQKAAAITAEQALREKAYAHGLQNEADIKNWAQKFGEFKAWDLGGAGAQPLQGPPALGTPTPAPGGVGPPTPGAPVPLGMGPSDHAAWVQKVQDLASTLPPDPKLREAFLGSVAEDKKRQAVQDQGNRISGELNDQILQGAGLTRLPDGSMDPSGVEVLKHLRDQVQNAQAGAEARSPEELAQLYDHIEQSKNAYLADVAQHNTQQHLRELQSKRMLQQIQDKWASGTSMADLADAVAYYNTYTNAVDSTPKDLGTVEKEFNEAISGVGLIKREAQMHKWENDRLRSENEGLLRQIQLERTQRQPTFEQRQQLQSSGIQERGQIQKDIAAGNVGARADVERERGTRVADELNNLVMRNALTSAQADKDWPKADTEEKQRAIVDKYVRLQQRKNGSLVLPGGAGGAIGPQSPADVLRSEVQSGKIKTNADLEARAKELGVTLK